MSNLNRAEHSNASFTSLLLSDSQLPSDTKALSFVGGKTVAWLQSAQDNFDKGNLITAYVHHAVARFLDCFTSTSTERIATALNIDTKEAGYLLNRTKPAGQEAEDLKGNSLSALRFSDLTVGISNNTIEGAIPNYRKFLTDPRTHLSPQVQNKLTDNLNRLETLKDRKFVPSEAENLLRESYNYTQDYQWENLWK